MYRSVFLYLSRDGDADQVPNSLFLNPEVWENCTNLWLGYNYCVQPVGTISTYTGYPGATPTIPFEDTPATSVPYKDLLANYTTNLTVIPLAEDTRLDCLRYGSTSLSFPLLLQR